MKNFFVTGTSTDVGKTYVICRLLEALTREGRIALGYKPLCCGPRDDVRQLAAASSGEPDFDTLNPIWLKQPLAPMVAAMMENQSISWDRLIAGYHALAQDGAAVIVEGAGGWKVPVTETKTTADLAVELGLPVVVVVDNRLGALNHTLLTVESIRASGLKCEGLIINHPREERDAASISNLLVLPQLCGVPILLEVMHGETEIEFPTF